MMGRHTWWMLVLGAGLLMSVRPGFAAAHAAHSHVAQAHANKPAAKSVNKANTQAHLLGLLADQCTAGIEEGMRDTLKKTHNPTDQQYIKSFAQQVCDCALPRIKNVIFSDDEKVIDTAMEKALHHCAQALLNK